MKGINSEFVNKLLLITVAGVIIWNFSLFSGLYTSIKSALTPLFIGIIIAIIINVPQSFFERKVFVRLKKPRFALSLICSLTIFFGSIVGFGFMVAPKVAESLQSVTYYFSSGTIANVAAKNALSNFLYEQGEILLNDVLARLNDYVPQLLAAAKKTLSAAINFFLGVFFAIMILINKKQLKRQAKRLINRFIKQEKLKAVYEMLELALSKFSKYLGGQIVEAGILGVICYVFMLALGLPFAPLISLITAVANLIPILGAYVGGAFSAVLIFAVNPTQALIFIIFIICLQQLESVTTYPIIVGRYVGLSSFWILIAVVIGGALFGFAGVFLGVPVTAFLHEFVGGLLRKNPPKSALLTE